MEQCELDAPKARGRDLATTELELNKYLHDKDTLTSEISNLNKRMSDLNADINISNQRLLRQQKAAEKKETEFAKEQEATARKMELRDLKTRNTERQNVVCFHVF